VAVVETGKAEQVDSIGGVVLLSVVSLLVGAALFLFALGLGLLRWVRPRSVLYLLLVLLLAAALLVAGAVQLGVYLVQDFAVIISTTWARRLALVDVGGGSGPINLVMGLAFTITGVLAAQVFYAGTREAVRQGRGTRRRARRRQVVQLFAASTAPLAAREARPTTNGSTLPGPLGRLLRLGFWR